MNYYMLHNKNSYCSLSNGLISLDNSRLPSPFIKGGKTNRRLWI